MPLQKVLHMENNRVSWHTATSKHQRLSILVLGSYEIIQILKSALLFENERKYAGRLYLQFSESIESIKNSTTLNIFSDYIIILMDPKDRGSISKVESAISQIEPGFLCSRLCLVNCKCDSKPSEWGIQRSYFTHVSERYQVNLINGDITVPDKCAYLVSRMLGIATAVCGYNTGNFMSLDPPLNIN